MRAMKEALTPVRLLRATSLRIPWDDRDDAGLSALMTFQGSLQLNAVSIVRGEKVGTNEQVDDRGRLQTCINLPSPLSTGEDIAIVPL